MVIQQGDNLLADRSESHLHLHSYHCHTIFIMSAKAISEFSGKHLLAHWLPLCSASFVDQSASNPSATTIDHAVSTRMASLVFDISELVAAEAAASVASSGTPTAAGIPPASVVAAQAQKMFDTHMAAVFQAAESKHPWLLSGCRLVCKPDQLVKRRGKNGLLGINLDWNAVKAWISARAGKKIKVSIAGVAL
ncbi:ATP citrate lyase subunit 1 [Batrachochytrium dendrobatidis]